MFLVQHVDEWTSEIRRQSADDKGNPLGKGPPGATRQKREYGQLLETTALSAGLSGGEGWLHISDWPVQIRHAKIVIFASNSRGRNDERFS
jgi:hypothetical protein